MAHDHDRTIEAYAVGNHHSEGLRAEGTVQVAEEVDRCFEDRTVEVRSVLHVSDGSDRHAGFDRRVRDMDRLDPAIAQDDRGGR
jgi:hypothetical protein